jgi:hypothetical protein
MANADIDIKAGSVMRNVIMRVSVNGVRTFRLRLWLGVQLIRLAAVAMGCGIQVDYESKP